MRVAVATGAGPIPEAKGRKAATGGDGASAPPKAGKGKTMNAFNPIESMRRYEDGGFPRKQAETLANELHGAMSQHVTNEQLQAAENRIVIKLGVVVSVVITLATSIILAVLSS